MAENDNDKGTPEEKPETRSLLDIVDGSSLGKIESLDDLPQEVRDFVERRTKTVVNEAREAWNAELKDTPDPSRRKDDRRAQDPPANPEDTPLTMRQFQELMRAERAQANAERQVFETLAEMGITKGSPQFKKLNDTFFEGLDQGLWDENAMKTKAGIRSLVHAAGLATPEDPTAGREHILRIDDSDALNAGGEKYLTEEVKGIQQSDEGALAAVKKALRDAGMA